MGVVAGPIGLGVGLITAGVDKGTAGGKKDVANTIQVEAGKTYYVQLDHATKGKRTQFDALVLDNTLGERRVSNCKLGKPLTK
jgi:hypothetical protein